MGSLISLVRMIAAAIAIMLGWNIYIIILHAREPFTYEAAYAENPVLKQGEALRAGYVFYRSRICRTELVRFIVDATTAEVMSRESSPGGTTSVGRATVVNTLQATKSLPIGDYIMRTFVYSDGACADHGIQSPDIRFKVIDG